MSCSFQTKKCIFLSRDVPVKSNTPYTDVIKTKKVPKDGHIKRPLNSFMLYSHAARPKIRQKHPKMKQQEISKILGQQWRALSPSEQKKYQDKYRGLNGQFHEEFPSYKFKPIRKTPYSARAVKGSLRKATKKSASCAQSTFQNLGTKNNSQLSDGIAGEDQDVVTGVREKKIVNPFVRRSVIPKKQLQTDLLELKQDVRELLPSVCLHQELLQPVSLKQESPNWDIVQHEALQCEQFKHQPLLQELVQHEPVESHPEGPLLGQSSSLNQAHNRLPFSYDHDINENDVLTNPANMNDVLPLPFLES